MSRFKCAKLITLLSALLLGWGGAAAEPPPEWFIDESKLPFEPLPDATAYWGVHTGAGYRIEVPDRWNGDLVIWAHGIRGFGVLELTVDNHPARELLIALGYAWAASSYRRNDYDVTSGVQDSHALTKLFNGLVGKPDRVYFTGASMGGHITAVAIEQYPQTYDGALAVCGALGDFELFDFFLDFNLAAQQLGTDTSAFPVDPVTYLFGTPSNPISTVSVIKANLAAFPGGWPLFLNPDGVNLKNLTELRSGGERPNFDEGWVFWNSIPSTSGPGNFLFELGTDDGVLPRSPGVAVDNENILYQFDISPVLTPDEQEFNDNVFRVSADQQARNRNGLAQLPVITGDIRVPVLTLHNLGDLFVPVHNEIEYARRVAARGNSDLLVQRAIRGAGHCDFTANEIVRALRDLFTWVESGANPAAKPAGDDWLDPAAVADPNFGCAFTDGPHFLGTPCP